MGNLTEYLDAYLPNEISNPNQRKLFEAWLQNQYEKFGDEFGGSLSISGDNNLASKMLDKLKKCFVEKQNFTECLHNTFAEAPKYHNNNNVDNAVCESLYNAIFICPGLPSVVIVVCVCVCVPNLEVFINKISYNPNYY